MVTLPEPGLYRGWLRHRRFRPKAHEFRYPIFMALLDVDRIGETMGRSLFSSYNRFNWAAFFERDHFGDPAQPLRERLLRDAKAHGIELPERCRIFLLTHLRYLGYCFNPISFFYFVDEHGGTPVVLAEVNNTFGERLNYWLGDHNRHGDGGMKFRCPKAMHVSPFMPMELDYSFALTSPSATLLAHMATLDGGEPLFDATLTLRRREWTSGELFRALASFPAMTAKVTFAIHWEALKLWIKGVPVYTHPDRIPKETHDTGIRA